MIKFEVDAIEEMNGELSAFIDYMLNSSVDEDAVFYSRLVSCELITNAIKHCGSSAKFSAEVCENSVKITVCASKPKGCISIPELPDVLAESGRGLYIINEISGGNVSISGGAVTVIIKRST